MRRSSKKLPKDPNKLALEIVRLSTEEPGEPEQLTKTDIPKRSPISEYLAEIGRKGGLKGGKARAEKLSAKKRKEIAQKAAKARWDKKP
jgi:hypothetical protein